MTDKPIATTKELRALAKTRGLNVTHMSAGSTAPLLICGSRGFTATATSYRVDIREARREEIAFLAAGLRTLPEVKKEKPHGND